MTCSGVCLRRFVTVENPPAPIIGDWTLTTPGPLHGDQVTAYRRAKNQKSAYDEIKARNDALIDPTLSEFFDAGKSDDEEASGALQDQAARNQTEVTDLLADVGVNDPPPTYNDMRLPVEYWSRRAALTDALIVFKTDGLLALGGVVVSTVASVMSLYV